MDFLESCFGILKLLKSETFLELDAFQRDHFVNQYVFLIKKQELKVSTTRYIFWQQFHFHSSTDFYENTLKTYMYGSLKLERTAGKIPFPS